MRIQSHSTQPHPTRLQPHPTHPTPPRVTPLQSFPPTSPAEIATCLQRLRPSRPVQLLISRALSRSQTINLSAAGNEAVDNGEKTSQTTMPPTCRRWEEYHKKLLSCVWGSLPDVLVAAACMCGGATPAASASLLPTLPLVFLAPQRRCMGFIFAKAPGRR